MRVRVHSPGVNPPWVQCLPVSTLHSPFPCHCPSPPPPSVRTLTGILAWDVAVSHSLMSPPPLLEDFFLWDGRADPPPLGWALAPVSVGGGLSLGSLLAGPRAIGKGPILGSRPSSGTPWSTSSSLSSSKDSLGHILLLFFISLVCVLVGVGVGPPSGQGGGTGPGAGSGTPPGPGTSFWCWWAGCSLLAGRAELVL